MKKIMFDDRFCLTEAVLEGRKTMTRRLVKCPKKFKGKEDLMLEFHRRPHQSFSYDCVVCDTDGRELGQLPLRYEIGDVVAVSQNYNRVLTELLTVENINNEAFRNFREWNDAQRFGIWDKAGLTNKMFVRADLMPHHVRITDLWFERLQDISEEDCLKEGIYFYNQGIDYGFTFRGTREKYGSAKAAFANLIDLVSHDHVWDCNPWVEAYTFEQID